jgi:biopolymer transport protein ExbD
MILGRNKIYWFVASFLALTIIVSLYILEGVNREEKDRIRDLSYLSVLADYEFYFGRDKIRLSDISTKIERLEKELGTDSVVHIKTSKSVKFSTIIELVKAVQETGHTRIGLPTIFKSTQWLGAGESEIQVLAQDCTAADKKPEIKIEEIENENLYIELNSQPISFNRVSVELSSTLNKTEDKTVCVQASNEIAYGRVAEILEISRRAGAENIRLMMDRRKPVKK